MDGTPCSIQPLTSKGRLSAMCVNDRGIFACSVDGQLLAISCKEYLCSQLLNTRIQNSSEYKYKLEVDYSQNVCCNCSIMKNIKHGKEYVVLGTEEGGIHIYEVLHNRLVSHSNHQSLEFHRPLHIRWGSC